ncbi:aminotransferase class I/II-fold pyridoxal phosphate-dependent enzyme [Flavihumibacter sp. R14]|nr:aminotransferase class I/II-fold pyridoxal phosphate-dependent enzyme [Flavihumibacter soli]
MISLASKLPNIGTNIFSVMSQLAADHKAINLSQGFPDFECPPELINLVSKHMRKGHNQYAPMPGIPALRERISDKIKSLHSVTYDPETEITVTAGGTQAIFTALAAVIQPNDEVIILEPAYDCYSPSIRLLGGLVKTFELSSPDYKIDWDMLKKLISSHTRLIILNSPHNPTGMILAEEDIRQLTHLTQNTDILILSDEVYEHIVFDGEPHLSMARYPQLRERSFIVASFGKLFHNTGWKMGYCVAPSWLMAEFRKVHQFLVFSVNTPVQYALADFMLNENFYLELKDFYQQKRDIFRELMLQTRFDLLPCQGSYFQCVKYNRIANEPDTEFARRLTSDFGVAGIPVSAFYNRRTDEHVLRFCFAKKQETLEKAVERLIKV